MLSQVHDSRLGHPHWAVIPDVIDGSPDEQRALAAGWPFGSALGAPALVLASGAAFMLSELADLSVYTPLATRWPAWAVMLSGLAGGVADSAVFLWPAFGSLAFVEGQIVGKIYASALFACWLAYRSFKTRPAYRRTA